MDILTVKLIVTPALMLIVSLAIRKWGGFIGGLLSGMPLTSGPIAVFLAIEQGPHFSTQAAAGALSGLAGVLLTYLFYLNVSRFLSVLPACIISLLFFGAASSFLLWLGSPAGGVSLGLLAIIALLRLTRPVSHHKWVTPLTYGNMLLRMVTATVLLMAITTMAHLLGPRLSGLLSPVPVIAWPVMVFAHLQGGRQPLAAVARGNAVSASGIILFYTAIMEMIPGSGLLATFSVAFGAAVFTPLLLSTALHFREGRRV